MHRKRNFYDYFYGLGEALRLTEGVVRTLYPRNLSDLIKFLSDFGLCTHRLPCANGVVAWAYGTDQLGYRQQAILSLVQAILSLVHIVMPYAPLPDLALPVILSPGRTLCNVSTAERPLQS